MEMLLTLDKDEVFDYLNRLKTSNVIHMSRAGGNLRDWFGCGAHKVLAFRMD